MKKNNAVIFKGGKNGIIVLLDEEASFKEISMALRDKVRSASGFFSGASTSLSFKGKKLSENEIVSLIKIIDEETDLSLTFVDDLTGSVSAVINPEKNITAKPVIDTYFHRHSLRSGQTIIQNGSVVVLGDVNHGAEIVATGNVLILGVLRGMVYAGSEGDEDAFVCAMSFQPTQIMRIAGEKVEFPGGSWSKKVIDPGFAFIKDGRIHVEFIDDNSEDE